MSYYTTIPLYYFMIVSAIIFTIGFAGLILRRDTVISLLMSIELMLLAANINFVAISAYSANVTGHIFTFFILCVAAAEVAIGLAILIQYFKQHDNINTNEASLLKDIR